MRATPPSTAASTPSAASFIISAILLGVLIVSPALQRAGIRAAFRARTAPSTTGDRGAMPWTVIPRKQALAPMLKASQWCSCMAARVSKLHM